MTTYDQVLTLAQRLPLAERLRLASALTGEAAGALASEPPAPAAPTPDGWTRWEQLRAELSAHPAGETSMAAQLEHDRAERQAAIEGHDVHP